MFFSVRTEMPKHFSRSVLTYPQTYFNEFRHTLFMDAKELMVDRLCIL